ncbi:hypothetical protein V9T40_000908 [Parthenolecanium corni]|uniref:Uncharacterized protein n=1 Tax=Parthenolecanium corni TaxID=536013 RepID=A0AAN9TBZ6_9HEMI
MSLDVNVTPGVKCGFASPMPPRPQNHQFQLKSLWHPNPGATKKKWVPQEHPIKKLGDLGCWVQSVRQLTFSSIMRVNNVAGDEHFQVVFTEKLYALGVLIYSLVSLKRYYAFNAFSLDKLIY